MNSSFLFIFFKEGDQPFHDLLQENEDMKERIRLLLLRNQELQDRNRKLRLDVKTLLKEINTCLVACERGLICKR